jgi:hypothetical protein
LHAGYVERVGVAECGKRCARGLFKESAMTMYTVGLKLRARAKAVTIEAEDALVAALKIKLDNPEAFIIYVRKANQRGDRRHPHEALKK